MHAFYCELLEKWAKTDVDALNMMDDWGAQRSLLISPALWKRYFYPMYKDYIDIAHSTVKRCLCTPTAVSWISCPISLRLVWMPSTVRSSVWAWTRWHASRARSPSGVKWTAAPAATWHRGGSSSGSSPGLRCSVGQWPLHRAAGIRSRRKAGECGGGL